ncbi:hypothetical protein AWW68_07065 [Roseivirga spongicola]|uniref:DUF4097 domain-containing protein n=2 Tax=Roseivirgaceae TaxID=2762306 RepID=A0A150XA88_9BACT|nr:hypothetical protein AWW68_07065 [Roseivirga spongicola]
MKEMRITRSLLCGVLVFALVAPTMAQNEEVKVDQKLKVKADPNVQVEVDPVIDLNFDTNIEVGSDFEANIQAFAESTVERVLDGFGMANLEKDKQKNKAEYQETTQEVEIPLSKPGERGVLDVDTKNGKIKITAYDGPTVKVKMTKYEKKVKKDESAGGLRLVSSGGFNFEASENNNLVKVENEGWNDRVDFEIQVPRNFNIKAEAYNNGSIEIDGVNGELNIESYNGPITLNNISGSASASTYNGSIVAVFTKVSADVAMAFSTYNGDVDVSVPNGTKFSPKMKTNREIYTDFESFSIKESKPVTKKPAKGGFNVKYENWVEADLNGGGAEVMMKTTNGNIFIRKK